MQSTAEKIKYHRRRAMLTQRELAAAAGVGTGTIARLEAGMVKDPHFSTIRKLALVLEVNPRDLVQMYPPPDPVDPVEAPA
jgi:predicted transcriptional regulator